MLRIDGAFIYRSFILEKESIYTEIRRRARKYQRVRVHANTRKVKIAVEQTKTNPTNGKTFTYRRSNGDISSGECPELVFWGERRYMQSLNTRPRTYRLILSLCPVHHWFFRTRKIRRYLTPARIEENCQFASTSNALRVLSYWSRRAGRSAPRSNSANVSEENA